MKAKRMKDQRRDRMKQLKPTKLSLPMRAKLARAYVKGEFFLDTLAKVGAMFVSAHGCDCCDSRAYQTWTLEGKTLSVTFGYLDIPKPLK